MKKIQIVYYKCILRINPYWTDKNISFDEESFVYREPYTNVCIVGLHMGLENFYFFFILPLCRPAHGLIGTNGVGVHASLLMHKAFPFVRHMHITTNTFPLRVGGEDQDMYKLE